VTLPVIPPNPDPPLDFPIQIAQDPAYTCRWTGEIQYNGVVWSLNYYADLSVVSLYTITVPTGQYFWSLGAPCSPGPFLNQTISPPDPGSGGTAYVLGLPIWYVLLLAKTYNLQPDRFALYDVVDSATPDHKCVRLTGRTYPGSVLIDLDLGAI
jgi:hypothetical protein